MVHKARKHKYTNELGDKVFDEKNENTNRLYLEGISLEKLFGSSNKAYNRRSDNVRTRFKKEAPTHQVIEPLTKTDENMLPISAHKHDHYNRYQKDSTIPRAKRKGPVSHLVEY